MKLADAWPPFGLRISCGPLVLRVLRDEDIADLTELICAGLRPDGLVPFNSNFDETPEPTRTREQFQHYWRRRTVVAPDEWALSFAVIREGEVIGVQDILTKDYPLLRTGQSGSWLGGAQQGGGMGTLMRQSLAAFMFDHLGAHRLTSAAFEDNAGSRAVSRKVGYRENGSHMARRADDTAALMIDYLLTPEDFVRPPHDVTVEGAEAFASFVGLTTENTRRSP